MNAVTFLLTMAHKRCQS